MGGREIWVRNSEGFQWDGKSLASHSRPKMAVGKGVSGTRFEIAFKALGLLQCFKGYVEFEFPRF